MFWFINKKIKFLVCTQIDLSSQLFTVCTCNIGLDTEKLLIFSYPSVLTYVLDAQKNRLIETVLLSTHNICFGSIIRKLNFGYALRFI